MTESMFTVFHTFVSVAHTYMYNTYINIFDYTFGCVDEGEKWICLIFLKAKFCTKFCSASPK